MISGFGSVDCLLPQIAINMLSAEPASMLLRCGSRWHKVPPGASARSCSAYLVSGLADHDIEPGWTCRRVVLRARSNLLVWKTSVLVHPRSLIGEVFDHFGVVSNSTCPSRVCVARR